MIQWFLVQLSAGPCLTSGTPWAGLSMSAFLLVLPSSATSPESLITLSLTHLLFQILSETSSNDFQIIVSGRYKDFMPLEPVCWGLGVQPVQLRITSHEKIMLCLQNENSNWWFPKFLDYHENNLAIFYSSYSSSETWGVPQVPG